MTSLPLFPSTATLFLDGCTVRAVGADIVQATTFESGECAEMWLEGAGYHHVTGPIWKR